MATEWIGVDLDGTLAEYDGWISAGHVGTPVTRMLNRVKQWLADGKEVKILTARVSSVLPDQQVEEAREAIQNFCQVYLGTVLDITAEKDIYCVELWDDRAIQVVKNTGERVDGKDND